MTAFVSCRLPRVASLEGSKAKSETKLRVCQKCGWKRHWLTTTATALRCFVSASSLFHSVTGRRRAATIKSVSWSGSSFGIHGKSNTSLLDKLKTPILFSPKTPKWVTHFAVRQQPNTPRFSSCLNRAWPEWLQVREKWGGLI